MKSRFSHVLTLLGALLAFLPIVGVDHVLDGYVRVQEKVDRQRTVDNLTRQVEIGINDALGSLKAVLASSPSLCTPTFVENVQREMEASISLKQVLVENADGVQYCEAFGRDLQFSPISESLPIPGRAETVTVVKLGAMDGPALKITQPLSDSRTISAFIPLIGQTSSGLAQSLLPGAMVRFMLTNGTSVLALGDTAGFDRRKSAADFIYTQGFAGELPLRVEYAVPFSVVRGSYATLDVAFTALACLMSAAFLILSLRYVRRSRVPAFDLERAIGRGEIKPYYQPVINLRTGALMGCEVLCRWEKRNGQVIPPGKFIDYAETSGLAIPMTLSLMQQVKYDLGDLCQQMPDLKISINLFEGHFRDDSVVEDVQAIFGHSAINFRQLVFEITERHPVVNSAIANSVIAALHALGCKLAMDDAGTGHSNLAHLGTLGIDVIKIDQIFVGMVKPETTQVPVLDGLITMARDMGCDIVAEGVETEAQAIYLRGRGVVQAQGSIFAPALRVGAFRDLALALNPALPATTRLENIAAAA